MSYRFAHEALDCYRLAVEVANWFQRANFPRGRGELKSRPWMPRISIVLNIAEGAGRRDGASDAGKNHHDIALGSASECCAILDTVSTIEGAADQQQKLRRIGAMLAKMRR